MGELQTPNEIFAHTKAQIIDGFNEYCRECQFANGIAESCAEDAATSETSSEEAVDKAVAAISKGCKPPKLLGEAVFKACLFNTPAEIVNIRAVE